MRDFRTELRVYQMPDGKWSCTCGCTIAEPFISPGQALEWAAHELRSEWLPYIEEELKTEVA